MIGRGLKLEGKSVIIEVWGRKVSERVREVENIQKLERYIVTSCMSRIDSKIKEKSGREVGRMPL